MLDRKDFIKIGDNVRDNYRTHIFTKGLDVNDKKLMIIKNHIEH